MIQGLSGRVIETWILRNDFANFSLRLLMCYARTTEDKAESLLLQAGQKARGKGAAAGQEGDGLAKQRSRQSAAASGNGTCQEPGTGSAREAPAAAGAGL